MTTMLSGIVIALMVFQTTLVFFTVGKMTYYKTQLQALRDQLINNGHEYVGPYGE